MACRLRAVRSHTGGNGLETFTQHHDTMAVGSHCRGPSADQQGHRGRLSSTSTHGRLSHLLTKACWFNVLRPVLKVLSSREPPAALSPAAAPRWSLWKGKTPLGVILPEVTRLHCSLTPLRRAGGVDGGRAPPRPPRP